VETKTGPRTGQPAAVRQPPVAASRTELTSPDRQDALIEELDEDDPDVCEIIHGNDEDQEDT
jgi:hypothetical protein